jgi:beta-N-acetylhexosaminidase
VGQRLLLAFEGKDRPSPEAVRAIREYRPAGISLFRSQNIDNSGQLRELNEAFQRLAAECNLPPLLIATDQEGGQLMAMGDGTLLPGNMALGAANSVDLARRAGEVLGREMAAVGVNVDYAPCVDVNLNPSNPVVGARSFGENPYDVARLGAAMVEGIQSQGVAATAKHFPGHGDTASDSHHGLASASHSLERLREVEFPPFTSCIKAGVRLVMSAHLALPAVEGPDAPPATLSEKVLKGLLREELGYEGVIVTDALNMRAIQQGEALGGEALRALRVGADLLLVTSDPEDQARIHHAVMDAVREGKLNAEELEHSRRRVLDLKSWLQDGPARPGLSVIRSAAHLKVADEIAEKSITLVRDKRGLLPIRLRADQRIAAILPKPLDLTPADTSSYLIPGLAQALRHYHPNVDEFIIPFSPREAEIGSLLESLRGYDLVVMGTLNAFEQKGQAALARQMIRRDIPTIMLALRLPYDLMVFPEAPTYLCTYSLLEPSLRAAAKCIFEQAEAPGSLPVSIPGLYEAGIHFKR